ncbi:MAG: L,D-transpeptidase family protein [Hamadaea sp.]|nr:L,D-transpeptidase family protein [Hamadaea sp.]
MRRRTIFATAATAAASSMLVACKDDPKEVAWSEPGPSTSAQPAPGAAALTIAPAAGATGISPAEPVVVTAVNATLKTVEVTSGGVAIAGELDATQTTWRSTAPLGYNKSYQVKAVGAGADGAAVEQTASFTTLKPTATADITLQVNAMTAMKDGGTYGVGQVVIAKFSKAPADRRAALGAIKVTSEPAVEGRWYWVDNRTAHYRPEKFWAKGTKISVAANLVGANLGKGVYGKANRKISFTIGASRIAIADDNTHYMRVLVDGVQVKNIAISMGKEGSVVTDDGSRVYFPTRSGTHVVMTRERERTMSSASYGVTNPDDPNYYTETIKLCCRISYSGEFVHSAPWSVWAQGKRNVSHGCINVAPSNAQWFYDNMRLGDPVIVKNTGRKQLIGDSAGAVWDVPWEKMIAEA